MFLLRKKVKAWSIQNPFGELSEKIEESELEQLITRLRLGIESKEDREKLYKGHMRLAMNIVAKYAKQAPNKIDDLISEAMLAISISIQEARTKLKDNNFTPYCIAKVHSLVYAFITSDHVAKVPISTITHKARIGEPIAPIKVESLTFYFDQERSKELDPEEMVPKRNTTRRRSKSLETGNGEQLVIIKEMIAKSQKTVLDRRVIHLRFKGHTDKEIAEILGLSVSRVNQIKAGVLERYEEFENATK